MNTYIYKQRLQVYYVDLDSDAHYSLFDVYEENCIETYAEITSWERGGYCSNYLLGIL